MVKYHGILFTKSMSMIFIPNFVFSQIRDIKHTDRNFHYVTCVMPQGLDLGVLGGQKLEHGDLRWRPIHCAF